MLQDDQWRAIDFSEQEAAALLAKEEQERREAEEAARMAQLHAEEEAAVAERVRAAEAELKEAHEAGIQAMGMVPTLTAKLSRLKTKAQEAAMRAQASRERADKERLEAETAIARYAARLALDPAR